MKKNVTIHIQSMKQKDEVKPVTHVLTPPNFYGKYKPRKQKDVLTPPNFYGKYTQNDVLTPPNFYVKYKPMKHILTKHPFEYNMEILNK